MNARCLTWDSCYDLMLMFWLCVGLLVCDVLCSCLSSRGAYSGPTIGRRTKWAQSYHTTRIKKLY
jgi:hypothetical protein